MCDKYVKGSDDKMAHAGGRPPKYSDEQLRKIALKFNEYIDNNELPIIAEFAYINEIDRTLLYDKEQFSTLLKKCIAKKEANLEINALKNRYNATMAIFSLKQMGWRDKQEVEHSGGMDIKIEDVTKLSDDELRRLANDNTGSSKK